MSGSTSSAATSDSAEPLAIGQRLNSRLRQFMLAGGVLNLGFIFAIHFFIPGQIAYVFNLFSFAAAMVAFSDLKVFPSVVVLGDGLEIGHRFVPYSAVHWVEIRRFRVAFRREVFVGYSYHGAECEVPISAFSFRNGKNVTATLARQLAERVGLPPPAIAASDSGTLWSR